MSDSISPEAKVIYDRVCEDVRACFRKSTRIEFTHGETRHNDRLVKVSVFARVYAEKLNYDHKGLLARICGTAGGTETEVEFSGKVERTDLRLRIATAEQPPSIAT